MQYCWRYTFLGLSWTSVKTTTTMWEMNGSHSPGKTPTQVKSGRISIYYLCLVSLLVQSVFLTVTARYMAQLTCQQNSLPV